MISTTKAVRGLNTLIKYNKIEFNTGNPYNLRWQWQFRNAYYSALKDTYEPTHVKKPEDTPEKVGLYYSYWQELRTRIFPTLNLYWSRRRRIMDPFQIYVLPSLSLFFYQFWDLGLGFKVFTILPAAVFYVRMRDKTKDPIFPEKYLRDIMFKNPEISQLFKS